MPATGTKRETVEDLIARLDAERNDSELMSRRYQELVDRIRAYEVKYGMTASDAHEAIERRELRETLEVCDWLMDAHRFEHIKASRAGRLTRLDSAGDLPQSPP